MNLKTYIKNNQFLNPGAQSLLKLVNYIEIKYLLDISQSKKFKKRLGYELNLNSPKTFNEKLQWLKKFYRDPIMPICVDKYRVREYVKDKIGEEYLVKFYGVYDSVDDIEIENLPDQFVLKPNHSSGKVIICKDKKNLNWLLSKKKLEKWLKENYYYRGGEWVYKEVKPKIICEKLLGDNIIDYKFFCFNGVPQIIQVDYDRKIQHKRRMLAMNWEKKEFQYVYPDSDIQIEKPLNFEKMKELSIILSERFPFVRVDFYEEDNKVYFGELTFFPENALGKFNPLKFDYMYGDLLNISHIKRN